MEPCADANGSQHGQLQRSALQLVKSVEKPNKESHSTVCNPKNRMVIGNSMERTNSTFFIFTKEKENVGGYLNLWRGGVKNMA